MCRYFSFLLFIGLVWGQLEIDRYYVDYYLEGEIVVLKDYNPKSFRQTGCLFSFLSYTMIFLIPVKHNLTTNSNQYDLFQYGYKNQIQKLRFKNATKGA